jgi:hypothetical protein
MLEIRLETEDGRFVCVASIPPFLTLPEVVLWGQRFFKLASEVPDALPVYREAFTVAVVIPVSYEERR